MGGILLTRCSLEEGPDLHLGTGTWELGLGEERELSTRMCGCVWSGEGVSGGPGCDWQPQSGRTECGATLAFYTPALPEDQEDTVGNKRMVLSAEPQE